MNDSENTQYYDLHTLGVGYLNRVREVNPEQGTPFLAVSVAAIHGKSTNVNRTYFDCAVYGKQAQSSVRALQAAVDAEKKVLVGFTLSSIDAEPYLYKQGEKAGQPGASLKARLIRIAWAKVDGAKIALDHQRVA